MNEEEYHRWLITIEAGDRVPGGEPIHILQGTTAGNKLDEAVIERINKVKREEIVQSLTYRRSDLEHRLFAVLPSEIRFKWNDEWQEALEEFVKHLIPNEDE